MRKKRQAPKTTIIPSFILHPSSFILPIRVIDTHTGGEPTRVLVDGGPLLGDGSLQQRRDVFRDQFDEFRSAVVCEPRGSDVMVGALLCPPQDEACVAGVIFFNNVGYLGMCGHGTIGVAAALAHCGRIGEGEHRLETPVGVVSFQYHGNGRVTLENTACRRIAANVPVNVEEQGGSLKGIVRGDVAWGGNWFFLIGEHGQSLQASNVDKLTQYAWSVRQSLVRQHITGEDGAEIDHIELFGPPQNPQADSRNFVLCPGKAYDRSPCGTGTSAKLACLCADGKLAPGEVWRQESIIGSVFEATYRLDESGACIPQITGEAFVTAEATLCFDERDPLRWGIRQ